MRALTYHGFRDVRIDEHPDPRLQEAHDAILDVTAAGICGSDLHLYHGLVPKTRRGDIFGHENVGVVEQTGDRVNHVNQGDRVVVPFPIAEGNCINCRRGLTAQCQETNPGDGSAIFGYSHYYGGIDGGQAERLRVPHADFGLHKLPDNVSDDAGVFLADVLPTAYQAVAQATTASPAGTADENALQDRTVAIYGCGPVGLLAAHVAKNLLGAHHVLAVDRIQERLDTARRVGADDVVDFEHEHNPPERVRQATDGLGADVAIDAVGLEASSPRHIASGVEKAVGALRLQTGSLAALRWATDSVRHGGAVSVPGVYAVSPAQNFPWGTLWEKGVRILTGQTHVHSHLPYLIDRVADGTLDPASIVTHHGTLDDGPNLYRTFEEKEDQCVKAILQP